MAKSKEIKTNAMRILDKNKVKYEVTMYPCEEFIDGIHVADLLGMPYERCFKTLVASGKSGAYHVFVIPVDKELDMKAAARAAGEKNIELIPVKEITPVTDGKVVHICVKHGENVVKGEIVAFIQKN
jgi:Cys-tRNA(Pro)/Cys-tRNA(Cys) deacylase